MGRIIKISEAAKMMGVCIATLHKWEKDGKLRIAKVNPLTRHRTYDEDEVKSYIATARALKNR